MSVVKKFYLILGKSSWRQEILKMGEKHRRKNRLGWEEGKKGQPVRVFEVESYARGQNSRVP